jgi:signal transduction histidine kinase
MRTLLRPIGFQAQETGPDFSERDLLTARGDQLHIVSLVIVFVYSILFTVANLYFENRLQAYVTIVPVPFSVLFYIFFRWGGVWELVSKLGNLFVLLVVLSILKLLDQQSATGVLAYFIPVMVGSMITFQGKQRFYAWSCVGATMVLLGFLSVTDIHIHDMPSMSESKLMQERIQNYLGAALVTAIEVGFLIWVSNKLQDRLLQNEQEKQRLTIQLTMQSQERQSNAVAIELHENINQILAAAKINLDLIPVDKDQKEKVQESVDHIEYALLQIRKLYQTLVTPDLKEFELTELIRQLVDEVFSQEDIRIEYKMELDAGSLISEEIKLCLYRIVQEYLLYVRLYAGASRLHVEVQDGSDKVYFSLEDDGNGHQLNSEQALHGKRSMENRARLHHGTIRLTTGSGTGCKFQVELPYE